MKHLSYILLGVASTALPFMLHAQSVNNKPVRQAVHDIEQKTVVGTILDENGEPLPGASIRIEGTELGTITDIDGNFSLLAKGKKPVLIVSYIGMKTTQEGDTVYLQNFVDGSLVKMDSAVVKGGAFEFKGTPDSVTVSRYVTYRKNGMRMTAMVFIEKGDITLNMGAEANKVAGTMCNDAYQQFMDKFVAINKEMSEIYQKSKTDTTLTDDQRKDLEKQLAEKDSLGTEMVYNCINENINNLVGVQLLTSYANAFETAKVKALLDKVPAAYSADKDIVALKEYIATIEKTEVGQKFVDFAMNTPEGKEVKLSDFISQNKYTLIDFWAS